MAVSLDAKGQVGGGVTLYLDTVQIPSVGVTLTSEGVNLTPVNAATLGPSGTINLSGTKTVNVLSSVGTVVGNFSVTGGSTRTYTYTLTTNPSSYFTVGGSTLSVLNTLSVGNPVITVRASDTGTSVLNGGFAITIFSTGVVSGALQFNFTTNSMYIGTVLGGIG